MNTGAAPDATDTSESFGTDVLGPIVAEFCARLWMYGSLLEQRADTGFLFCARGGLRMHYAFERFLLATELAAPAHIGSLMVSRLAAVRPAVLRGLDTGSADLAPAAAETLGYEFPRSSVAEIAEVLAGVPLGVPESWAMPFTSRNFVTLLRHRDGEATVAVLRDQASLFARHLEQTLDGRSRALLVDTGLFGTTQQLIAEGFPQFDFSSALIARSNYRQATAAHHTKVTGLSLQANAYLSWNRRSSILRYWHYIESLFEPNLPSVRWFVDRDGRPVSNLEITGWQTRIEPRAGSAFDGVVKYLDSLSVGSAGRVVMEADHAWTRFRKAVVWPNAAQARMLDAGERTGDFGTTLTWTARTWEGPVAALRGSSMWREGEIALSRTPFRLPLLAMIEGAHGARQLTRSVRRRLR